MQDDAARPKLKNLFGMVAFIIGLTLYAFAAAALGETLADFWVSVQIAYYVFAGIIWIWPAKMMLMWMAKKAREPS